LKRNQTLHERLIPFLARELGVRRYLELGIHENETIKGVAWALPPDSVVVAVDRNAPASRVKGVAYRIMTTSAYLTGPVVEDAPFDLVFIDADHSAEAVMSDFSNVWPYVAPDGLVLLHDTNPETIADTVPGLCGVGWKAAHLLAPEYESLTLPYHPGLTLIRKRVRWGPLPALPVPKED
jgi:predicted O-methyltransferase YrrM